MKKKLMSIMTATAMTLSAIPFAVSAETTDIPDSTAVSIEDIEIVAQGKCGENAEWTIDNNGTLVISGTGRTEYDYSNMLFSSYSDKIVNAVVGEGITTIDICFFMNCKNLKSVTLPESLESILGGAFDNCENLSEINIPENTTYIAGNVFKDTLWLENKRAENPLVIVNNMVIDGKNCKGNVVIPDGVTTILGGAFENATDISSVKIPETVTYILEYAFINCTSLKSVKLPNGITKIKVLCFAGCSSLESVEIPASVEIIENDVFFGCTALKEIEIPQNTIVYSNSIGYYGESECKKIEDIILKGYSNSPAQAYAEKNGFKFVAIDEDTDTTEIVAQGECGDATWTLDSNGTLTLSGTGFADPDHYFSTPFRDLADEVTAVVINDGITTLEPYLFKDFSNLKTVSLPDGLLAIYKDVFENCENLTEINIPDSVIYIGVGAFENTAWLKNKQSENPLVIGGNVVIDGKGCKGDVVIPDGITAVGSGAFEWCNEITSVKLPDSLTFIGEYAFYHCELIETLDMPKNVSVIKEYAFSECGSLKSIDIPDGVKYIYENTFEGCYLLEKVTLPESLLFIGENAFRDCESLKEMGIPSKAEICRYAVGFSGSDNEMITDFVIKGYKGTFAETYAEENGFKFVAIDEKTDEIKGDANCDGNVNMADAVLIMQSLANPDKYGVNGTDETHITAQGEKNGDMDGNGLTNADALEIQKILLKLNDTPEQISPIQPPTVQPIHFENISSLAKEINDYDLDKYSEISREGYRKMYDTIKNDGSIYEVKVNETVNIDLERGIAVVPNAKYEDLGIYSYTKNDFQIIVYYIDKGTEHNGIADYFTKRFSQNILKEISVNGKETVISEFGITDDTRRICASAFIDDSHYYTVRSCVGGTEEELTAFLNNMTFVNVPIA